MNDDANKIRLSQELEYWFPYHYVSVMPTDGFQGHYVDTWGVNYISTIEFILEQISKHPASSVVDVGCGDGRLTREIKLAFPECHAFGIDYSPRAIKLAQAMNQDIPDLNFIALDITAECLERKFDTAILMEVFEHVPIKTPPQKLMVMPRMATDQNGPKWIAGAE
ncbi:MAG: methyltransferase domain-containing protein [Clostridia bacterium]|nr:methyltransferase domain-containing protein [Clostridia bacterium]